MSVIPGLPKPNQARYRSYDPTSGHGDGCDGNLETHVRYDLETDRYGLATRCRCGAVNRELPGRYDGHAAAEAAARELR